MWAQRLSASGQWADVFIQESKDAVDRAKSANPSQTFVEYQATGLAPGERYRFRAAWCRRPSTTKGCNCYPNDAGFVDLDGDQTADQQPSAFPAGPVGPPFSQVVEDRFDRGRTTPKRDRETDAWLGGDGLGPAPVYSDDATTESALSQNGSFIDAANGRGFASIPENAQISYKTPFPEQRGFADVEFRPHCTTAEPNPLSNSNCTATPINYRVDARPRVKLSAGTPVLYMSQVAYEPEEDPDNTAQTLTDRPLFRVLRGAGGLGTPLVSRYVEEMTAYSNSTEEGCTFDGVPSAPDTNTERAGLVDDSVKVLRVDARNGLQYPTVRATLGWDCGGGTCRWLCYLMKGDTPVGGQHPLFDGENQIQGLMVHHWDAAVVGFRAGNAP